MLPATALAPTVKRRRSRARFLAVPTIVFLLGTALVADGRADDDAPGPTAIDARLASFFEQHCIACHGAEKQEAKVAVHALADRPRSEVELALWKRVVGQLESGHMPPNDAPQPSPQARRQAIAAIYEALERIGIRREGIEVDHDALFSGNSTPDAYTATDGRVWRLTQSAYENSLRESFRGVKSAARVRAPWEMLPDPKTGFSDFASAHRIGEAELEHHLRNVVPIVREMANAKSSPPELAALTKVGKAATATQIDAGVAAVFRKILRRDPADNELQRYAAFVRKNLDQSGAATAIEQLALAVLLHPEVFYRVESAEKDRSQILTPHHLARAIAYTLTDQGPDATLSAAAAENKLQTPDEVRTHVLRILNDPQTSKLRQLRFFQEYFGYTAAPDVFKDAPTLQAAHVVDDTKLTRKETVWADAAHTFVRDADWLILDTLAKDRNVLRELLTTRETFTKTKTEHPAIDLRELLQSKSKYKTNDTTRGFFRGIPVELRIYELDELAIRRDSWAPDRRYLMPVGHRAGMLTHPAWLIAQSDNFDNNPIHRGKWIREKLLGEKLPEIPITVDAKLPDEPHHTLRERMRVTREAYCWKCHERMDPLGLPFEMYDHFGRYRETELDKPVDTSGYLTGTGDPKLDGPVKTAVEMIDRLAASKRVEQVFVRHVFRYFIGRNETLNDGPTLVQAHRAYAESGGSMQTLLASLLTSPAFLERAATTEPKNSDDKKASSLTNGRLR